MQRKWLKPFSAPFHVSQFTSFIYPPLDWHHYTHPKHPAIRSQCFDPSTFPGTTPYFLLPENRLNHTPVHKRPDQGNVLGKLRFRTGFIIVHKIPVGCRQMEPFLRRLRIKRPCLPLCVPTSEKPGSEATSHHRHGSVVVELSDLQQTWGRRIDSCCPFGSWINLWLDKIMNYETITLSDEPGFGTWNRHMMFWSDCCSTKYSTLNSNLIGKAYLYYLLDEGTSIKETREK